MNDFYRIKVKGKENIRTLSPYDTMKWHKRSVNFINKTCKKYPDKKIVVVTHHAPSADCISDEYKGDMLNAAFASNLEWVMEEKGEIVKHRTKNSIRNVDLSDDLVTVLKTWQKSCVKGKGDFIFPNICCLQQVFHTIFYHRHQDFLLT